MARTVCALAGDPMMVAVATPQSWAFAVAHPVARIRTNDNVDRMEASLLNVSSRRKMGGK
jgi:hypothetical protein